MLQSADLKLRTLWAFWDTHGTRLLGVVSGLHAGVSAIAVVLTDADAKVAGVLLGISAFLGAITRARGQTNAALPPAAPNPGG